MPYKKWITILPVLAFCAVAEARTFKASIAQLPVVAESRDKGFLPELVRALAKASGEKIEFEVIPFARSMKSVQEGKVDFHIPLIEPPNMEKANFKLSSDTVFKVNFVLYSNKKNPLDMKELSGKRIESDVAHIEYFPFKVIPSSCIECSLKKVDAGRIDGFIFADSPSDPIVKSQNLKNIRRQLYRRFNVKIVLNKGARSTEVDEFLTKTLAKLRKSGELKRIIGSFEDDYSDWQP